MVRKWTVVLAVPVLGALVLGWRDIMRFAKIKMLSIGAGHRNTCLPRAIVPIQNAPAAAQPTAMVISIRAAGVARLEADRT
jgi:hypothetical protein